MDVGHVLIQNSKIITSAERRGAAFSADFEVKAEIVCSASRFSPLDIQLSLEQAIKSRSGNCFSTKYRQGLRLQYLTRQGPSFTSTYRSHLLCSLILHTALQENMIPPFGFSVGDFINAIGLANQIKKALKDIGGSEDDIQMVTQDLQHLELVLIQLRDGDWATGGDLNHINAIRGIAVSCEAPLKEFLHKVEGFHSSVTARPGSSTKVITRSFKKAQWAISMKEAVNQFRLFVLSKIVTASLLLALPMG